MLGGMNHQGAEHVRIGLFRLHHGHAKEAELPQWRGGRRFKEGGRQLMQNFEGRSAEGDPTTSWRSG
jgi:hypothetical protein